MSVSLADKCSHHVRVECPEEGAKGVEAGDEQGSGPNSHKQCDYHLSVGWGTKIVQDIYIYKRKNKGVGLGYVFYLGKSALYTTFSAPLNAEGNIKP